MLPVMVNFIAMLLIAGFFLRWIQVQFPESAIGKGLAFIY